MHFLLNMGDFTASHVSFLGGDVRMSLHVTLPLLFCDVQKSHVLNPLKPKPKL